MMSSSSAPSLDDLTPLAAQVAGHDGVQSLAGGSLVFKPAKDSELQFYSSLSALPASLLPFLPAYHGALPLPSPHPEKGETHGIILENLAARFKRPNILDVKLGTQLWDSAASAEKRERMEKQSRESTSGSHGLRLTGWRILDNAASSSSADDEAAWITIPKLFGKTITPASLPLGIRHFFSSPHSSDSAAITSILSSPSAVRTSSLPRGTMRQLLEHGILPRMKELREEVAQVEWRVRGGSVLLIYEGDETTLVQNLERASQEGKWEEMRVTPASASSSTPDASSADDSSSMQPIFDVRLIDFAHVESVPGEGPDEGVLLGLDTTIALLQELLAGLKEG